MDRIENSVGDTGWFINLMYRAVILTCIDLFMGKFLLTLEHNSVCTFSWLVYGVGKTAMGFYRVYTVELFMYQVHHRPVCQLMCCVQCLLIDVKRGKNGFVQTSKVMTASQGIMISLILFYTDVGEASGAHRFQCRFSREIQSHHIFHALTFPTCHTNQSLLSHSIPSRDIPHSTLCLCPLDPSCSICLRSVIRLNYALNLVKFCY